MINDAIRRPALKAIRGARIGIGAALVCIFAAAIGALASVAISDWIVMWVNLVLLMSNAVLLAINARIMRRMQRLLNGC